MALFAVERYLGDDEEEQKPQKLKAADILKKIQDEARARRKSLSKDVPEQQAKKQESNVDDSLEDTDEVKDKSKKEKKKKRKRKHEGVESSENDAEHVGSEAVQTKKQKKRTSIDTIVDSKASTKEKVTKKEKKDKRTSLPKSKDIISEKNDFKKKVESASAESSESDDKSEDKSGDSSDDDTGDQSDIADVDDGAQSDNADDGSEEGGSDTEKEPKTPEKTKEVGGFTVIGNVRPAKPEKVMRVLPDWLSNPSVVSGDLKSSLLPVMEMPGLDTDLKEKLIENKIDTFFPVQMQVIPALLETCASGFHTGRAGYRPSDLCVSAPTGSGKTLAFVLPIVQALRSRVRCEVRALVVLPVRELATQVFKVFQTYCQGTTLKVGLLVGQKTFSAEQQVLVTKRLRGYQSLYDIVVATPGRLVDHINKTEGFTLKHLRYLVMDEADRMMDEVKQDWLLQVETAVHRARPQPRPLTARHASYMDLPLQKLLYSATLSQNPEKLQQLNLFQPKLFTSVVKVTDRKNDRGEDDSTERPMEGLEEGQLKTGDFVGKYSTPAGLTEYSIETTTNNKPLILLHLIHQLQYRNILCFTNSVDTTHRLYLLLKLVGGVEVREFSSGLHASHRDRILQRFAAGKVDIIICTDAMARGMDISNVKYVVSYDPPGFIQTYIHRIGRTARAGKDGTAFTFLQGKEFFHFKKMVREAGKQKVSEMKVSKTELKPQLEKYEAALKQLPELLQAEKDKKNQKKMHKGGEARKAKTET